MHFAFGYKLFLLALWGLILPAAAHAQISVPGRHNFDFEVRPGDHHEGSFEVQNTSDRPQVVRLYQTDYTFSSGGETYGEPGTLPRSNAGWIRFSPSSLTLAPGESGAVHFSVDVPEAASAGTGPGSFWSMLMVEAHPVEALATAGAQDDPTLRLNVVMRYGIQLHARVAGEANPKLAFVGAKLRRDEGLATRLEIDAENTGETMVGPQAWVELYDGTGQQVARADAPKYRIYPDTSVRYDFDLSGVAAGTYQVLVILDAGTEEVFGAQYTVEL